MIALATEIETKSHLKIRCQLDGYDNVAVDDAQDAAQYSK